MTDTTFSATVDVPAKSETELKQLALDFSKESDRFLITNDRVPDPVGNYNKKCRQNGSITQLYECEACPKSVAAIKRFVNKSIENLATEYTKYLSQ